MAKHLEGYEMSKRIDESKVSLKIFGGAKVRCMENLMKLSVREKSFILQIGIIDLNIDRESELNSKSILDLADLAFILKSNSIGVSISRRSSHRSCSLKKLFLKVLQNSQKSICVGVSDLLTVNRPVAYNFIKKENSAQVFSCEFCEFFKNAFFTEQLWATASLVVMTNKTRKTLQLVAN